MYPPACHQPPLDPPPSQFGEAFEAVPRILADNSGPDATALISQLYTAHQGGDKNAGVEIEPPHGVKDAAAAKVLDLMVTKESALRLAVDAAITVLRVDQIIMSKPAGGGKAVGGPGGPR